MPTSFCSTRCREPMICHPANAIPQGAEHLQYSAKHLWDSPLSPGSGTCVVVIHASPSRQQHYKLSEESPKHSHASPDSPHCSMALAQNCSLLQQRPSTHVLRTSCDSAAWYNCKRRGGKSMEMSKEGKSSALGSQECAQGKGGSCDECCGSTPYRLPTAR